MVQREGFLAAQVRWFGLLLFPTLVLIADLAGSPSRRQIFLFLSSFSFQTSLIGWLYLLTRNSTLGMYAVRYLSVVALVWLFALGGKESSTAEKVFNELLHYAHPLCVMIYSQLVDARVPGLRPWLQGLLYPLGYFFYMLLVNRWIGYELYPILSENPLLVVSIFAITEALLWHDNQL